MAHYIHENGTIFNGSLIKDPENPLLTQKYIINNKYTLSIYMKNDVDFNLPIDCSTETFIKIKDAVYDFIREQPLNKGYNKNGKFKRI